MRLYETLGPEGGRVEEHTRSCRWVRRTSAVSVWTNGSAMLKFRLG
jgi:hypothetical protein